MNPDGTRGETWNPVIGCTRVSEGCRNCYAERMANRLSQNPTTPEYTGLAVDGRWTGQVKCLPERLAQPLRWRKPRRIFVNSMSDLFHEDVPDGFIRSVYSAMEECPQHTFMILTKRPERMVAWVHEYVTHPMRGVGEPPRNVWLGVSVEDQKTADDRIPWLSETPAVVRFVSAEPLLGPVDLKRYLWSPCSSYDEIGIHWVITGGETGPGARPAHPDWFRQIRDECQEAGVPYFHKQMARKEPIPNDLLVREFPREETR